MTTPAAVLNNGGEKKKWNNIPKIVATFIYASSQGQRTHSARTNNAFNSGHFVSMTAHATTRTNFTPPGGNG